MVKPIKVPGFGYVAAPPKVRKHAPPVVRGPEVHEPSYAQFVKWLEMHPEDRPKRKRSTRKPKAEPKPKKPRAKKRARRGPAKAWQGSARNNAFEAGAPVNGSGPGSGRLRPGKKKRKKRGKLTGAAKAAFLARMARGRARATGGKTSSAAKKASRARARKASGKLSPTAKKAFLARMARGRKAAARRAAK